MQLGEIGILTPAVLADPGDAALSNRLRQCMPRGALRDGADINWPVSADPSGTRRLVQWCHGAPGVGAALGRTPRIDSTGSAVRERFGQGKYTLWTGDAGLAVCLHHCLAPEHAALPGLELF